MKSWHYYVLSALGILAIAYVYFHRQDLGLVGSHESAAGDKGSTDVPTASSRPPRIAWQTVDRPKDGFRVEMPIEVKEIQIPAYNERGNTDQVNMIFSNPASDITFSLSWADNPPVVRVNGRSPDRTLDMARDEALARTQTSLIKESRNLVAGFPARDFEAKNVGGGVMDVRLVDAGERLYMLTAVFPNSGARREQDVTRFFNSFNTESQSIPSTMPMAQAP